MKTPKGISMKFPDIFISKLITTFIKFQLYQIDTIRGYAAVLAEFQPNGANLHNWYTSPWAIKTTCIRHFRGNDTQQNRYVATTDL